jgi:hypothetical protein
VQTNLDFSPSNGLVDLQTSAPGLAMLWTGELEIDVTPALEDNNIEGGASKVSLLLTNMLATMNESGRTPPSTRRISISRFA